ncbi:hypothetical protein SEA_HORUS_79 [Gordonia phage Horus]|uniref:Uncharacterized protein n=2 Tax=Langleyhallvirinae TaxID=2732613 RepID=A0A385DZ84_9CAUD|nr:hypothetical protein HOT93_gp071 [Gordonia phage Horus]YP_009808417.1 hypothetical protein HOT94_gp076 [Gordonia phage Phistory]AXQ63931.1 hypothetical protein SEA_HORUS_79 [Gordonia phage Horus]AXQ64781.1 hypothetical protein SEA_PHISTORY_76 [Gordonia phage Phistory]WNM69784.1 hypothetical protein SEA_CRATER_77 [Gordonia phage Crater]
MSDIGFGPVGDPPIIYDTERTDGYGRVTRLVDRRLLEQAEARIAELERESVEHASTLDNYRTTLDKIAERIDVEAVPYAELPGKVWKFGGDCNRAGQSLTARHKQDIIDRYKAESEQRWNELLAALAERDHWRAEAEKARTPDASNPKDLRSVADLLERVINVRRSPNTCPDLRAAADRLESESTADEWCREESCRYRHWRSGDMPTHRRGEHCPPVTPEATADDVVEKVARVPHAVHNHGSEDGPGLACNEVRLTDGRKLGVCLLPHLRGDR